MKIQTINPTNEQVLASYDCLNEKEIYHKIDQGQEAYLTWRQTSFSTRKQLMNLSLIHI